MFLVSQPGPYARRLALTFCHLVCIPFRSSWINLSYIEDDDKINAEYEYISLHRDVGETELKQGREIRGGGVLAYIDSAAVRAVKHGRILIIDGIEKAERGIMPVLNNLLENREMNLDDGTHIIHPTRHARVRGSSDTGKSFIPAHASFRVIALGVPVPPYKGFPLDPPFRSRFQARFLDPLGTLVSLAKVPPSDEVPPLLDKLRDIIFSVQYASGLRNPLENISRSTLPQFPQNSLQKLTLLLTRFPPPPESLAPDQLARFVLSLHPQLAYAPFEGWALLSHQFENAGLGMLASPSTAGVRDGSGFFGYRAVSIQRVDTATARVIFEGPGGSPIINLNVPAGPHPLSTFPPAGTDRLIVSNRFFGLLTCFLQSHALGWDISFVPPVLHSTATCSTSLLVKTFAEALGYEVETVHLYKEIGGREMLMRRKIGDGGATSWEPRYAFRIWSFSLLTVYLLFSPLIQSAWAGRLVHLSGLDVIGSTAGSIARLLQDREIELWEGKRIVASASDEEVQLNSASPPFFFLVFL